MLTLFPTMKALPGAMISSALGGCCAAVGKILRLAVLVLLLQCTLEKVWLDGAWVDRQQAKQARTPATEYTLKKAPASRPPKGKSWDAVAGCWVAKRNTVGLKRKALAPAGDVNPPQWPNQRTRRR